MKILRVVRGTIHLALIIFATAPAFASLEICHPQLEPRARLALAEKGLRDPNADASIRGRLLSCRGDAAEDLGRINDAARDYAEALAIAERSGDRELRAEVLVQNGYLRYYRGDFGDAIVDLQLAYELNTALGRDDGRREALANMAHVYSDDRVAQYDKAIEYYTQLLPEYQAAKEDDEVADTYFNLGSTSDRKGNLTAALTWYQRALAAEQKLGRARDAAYVKRSIGMALTKLDKPLEAMHWFDEALAFYEADRSEEGVALVRQSRGIANHKLNRTKAAIADLEASRTHFKRTSNARFLEKSEDELAEVYASAGRWKDAFYARTSHAAMQRELADKLREEHTSRLRVQFDSEKKEQENRALTRIRRLQNIVLVLSAAVMLALLGLVVRHFSAARRMRVLAMTDELTRLPNRRHLFTTATEQLQAARKNGDAFSVVVFDIDHFKRINDTWGHAAGDVVLQRVAHACRAATRPQDAIGRTGGEEFMVSLPHTAAAEATRVAERLRNAVEELDFTDIDPTLHVTISLGVAERMPTDATLAKIAGRADDVLYRAKEGGRNRVEVAA